MLLFTIVVYKTPAYLIDGMPPEPMTEDHRYTITADSFDAAVRVATRAHVACRVLRA